VLKVIDNWVFNRIESIEVVVKWVMLFLKLTPKPWKN
jgi:hypothetical protein